MTMEELHAQLFELMCMVDDICSKENIMYFLNSGSEIGAVREHGFIPWDDDVDLMVLREDYPRFCDAMRRHLPDYMVLAEPSDFAPGFYDFITHLVDMRQPLRKETEADRYYHNYQNRVGIDVFIYDKAPDSGIGRKWMMLENKILYGLAMSRRYAIDWSKYKGLQKAQVAVLCTIGKVLPLSWIIRRWNKAMSKCSGRVTKWRFTSNFSLDGLRFFSSDLFDETIRVDFNGRQLPIPSGYDKELTMLYGDYMHPPKDKSIYRTHAELEGDPEQGEK